MRKPTRRIAVHAFTLVFLLAGALAYGQEQRQLTVAVRPFTHGSSVVAQQLASAAQSTIHLTLRLLGSYRVRDLSAAQWHAAGGDRAACARYGLDDVVSGSVSSNGGEVTVSLQVYNASRGRIVIERSGTSQSYIGIFGLVDRTTLSLLEGFTQRKLAFGALRFRNIGLARPYEVFIDGHRIGRDLRVIARITAGRHRVRIEDLSLLRTVFQRIVTVAGHARTQTVTFSIPLLYPNELQRLGAAESDIFRHWDLPFAPNQRRIQSQIGRIEAAIRLQSQGRPVSELAGKFAALDELSKTIRPPAGDLEVRHITVDGDPADWNGVPVLLRRPGGNTTLSLARNREATRIFFLLRVARPGGLAPRSSYRITLRGEGSGVPYTVSISGTGQKVSAHSAGRGAVHVRSGLSGAETVVEGSIDLVSAGVWSPLTAGRVEVRLRAQTGARPPVATRAATVYIRPRLDLPFAPRLPAAVIPGNTNALDIGGYLSFAFQPSTLARVHFVPFRHITVDGSAADWKGIAPIVSGLPPGGAVTSWNSGSDPALPTPHTVYVARDARSFFIRMDLTGPRFPSNEQDIAELILFADPVPGKQGSRYFFEARLQGGQATLGVRRTVGQHDSTEVMPRIPAHYAFSPDGRTLEMSFPIAVMQRYMREKASYTGRFEIWNANRRRFNTTRDLQLALY